MEPISSTRRNVKKGEHSAVVCKLADKKPYTQRRIVVRVRGNKVDLVEYGYEPSLEDMAASTVLTADVGKLGKIKFKTCTIKELEEEEVEWPSKLIGKSSHDLNSEHFVTWCIYRLLAGVSVETCIFLVCRAVAGKKLVDCNALNFVSYLLRLLSRVLVDFFVQCEYTAFIIGAVIETGFAIYEIKKAFEQRESGLITSDEHLKAKVVGIIAKAVCRFGLPKLMSKLGAAYGGPAWSLVGEAFGEFIARLIEVFFELCLGN